MYKWKICIKKGKSTRFLALKIWALAVLKFFYVVLKFELPIARFLNFPKNSASVLILPVLIIGDWMYLHFEFGGSDFSFQVQNFELGGSGFSLDFELEWE
jgi:hypothetical protein